MQMCECVWWERNIRSSHISYVNGGEWEDEVGKEDFTVMVCIERKENFSK